MPKAKKTAKEIKAETVQKVEKVTAGAAEAVEEAKAQVEKAVEEVKPAVEQAVKATRANAAIAGEKVKSAAARVVGAEAAPVVYVQYQGEEEKVEDLVAGAKASFAAEHPGVKVNELKLYIKPEERAAYYVINEKFAGRVDF